MSNFEIEGLNNVELLTLYDDLIEDNFKDNENRELKSSLLFVKNLILERMSYFHICLT